MQTAGSKTKTHGMGLFKVAMVVEEDRVLENSLGYNSETNKIQEINHKQPTKQQQKCLESR